MQLDTNDPALTEVITGLNPQQAAAVCHRGPALLIVAGAGSGKTRVLTDRIAGLLATGEAWPSQILAITFTNKAAAEMRERVVQLIGPEARGMWISTFHSACVRILRNEAPALGFSKALTIYDSNDTKVLLKRLIKEKGAERFGFTPGGVAGRISKQKNELKDAESYAHSVDPTNPAETMFLEIFRQYTRMLQQANAFDFDDLIGEVVYLFREYPEVAAQYRYRFRHILVDEYQDTNHAQYSLIHELTRAVVAPEVNGLREMGRNVDILVSGERIPGASLTVVGDSDQSIYAFRGADIRNISEFERDFPGAEVILLEQNYRSTQNILSAANAVISQNFDRKDKKLWTSDGDGEKIVGFTGFSAHDEAQFVADEIEILHRSGVNYREMAVFYRTNTQTRALEEIFVCSAVPYRVIGGTRFYERKEIKDALAYLTVVANPADNLSMRRILNTPKRGVGSVSETQLIKFAEQHEISVREALDRIEEVRLSPKITAGLVSFAALLAEVSRMASPEYPGGALPVNELLEKLMNDTGLIESYRSSSDPQEEARADNIKELIQQTRDFAAANEEANLLDYLTQVSLVAAADELDDESGTVSLMTLHTAKGLEFHTVFLTGIEEGLLPHQMSANEPGGPAEERRLFYVGITRARSRLYLSLAMNRSQFGEVGMSLPSKFLNDIPAGLINWRQAPGTAASRMLGVTRSRVPDRSQLRPGGSVTRGNSGSYGYGRVGSYGSKSSTEKPAPKEWSNRVSGAVRDNGDLTLSPGDRVRHIDFGEGIVAAVSGEGNKRVAQIRFVNVGAKKLLVKIAPIEKID